MKIEQAGLDAVPVQERTASGADMFFIWSGISLCLPSFIIGAILIPSFGWAEAVSINFLGNLAVGCLIVLGGYYGTRTGQPAVIFGKSVFGEKTGHLLPTASLVISTLGWFAVITALTGQALDEIIKIHTGYSNLLILTVLAGLLNTYTAVLGMEKIRSLSRLSVPIVLLFCLWITVQLLGGNAGPQTLQYQKTGDLSYWQGIDLIIGGYIAGALAASDFTRYTGNNMTNWLGVLPGTFLVSFFLGLIGMLCTAATGEWNPVLMILGFGMGIPALAFITLANWTTNYNLLYSSGLALTNLLPGLGRWLNTLICGITGTILAVLGIENYLENMLSLLGHFFTPIVGVMLTDYFVIKRLLNIDSLASTHPGINAPALVSIFVCFGITILLPDYLGKSVVGLALGSLCYFIINLFLLKSNNSGNNK